MKSPDLRSIVRFVPIAAAVLVGVYLRWQQWPDQVLLDDEWHLVHRLVLSTPRQMFLDFGFSDYSIPLGLLYSMLAAYGDLSELTLRLPMLVFGIATLFVLPWLVVRRVGLATTTVFAWLLAISPLLPLLANRAPLRHHLAADLGLRLRGAAIPGQGSR